MTAAYPISRYLNVHAAYRPVFTGGGREIAFLSTITGTGQLWRVAVPAEAGQPLWPDQLSFDSDRVMDVWAAPDGHSLIYSQDVGGNENAQLFLRRYDGEETNLTAGHEDVMHIFGCWAPENESIIFAANRRHKGRFDLFLQPLDGSPARRLLSHDDPGYLWAADITPDGSRLVVVRAAASAAHELFELDLAGGKWRRLSPADRPARFLTAHYTPAGDALVVLTDLDNEFLHVALLDLATGMWSTIVQHDWDINVLALSHDRRRLAYTLNIDGNSELILHELDSGNSRRAELPAGAPGIVAYWLGKVSFSPDDRRLAFAYTSAVRTSDVYVWELETDDMLLVTRSSHGGLPLERFVAPRLVHFPTFDERRIPAWFYWPEDVAALGPLPVVVLVHGGPESQFRPFFHFFVQYLVHNGYAVLAPNVRGSTGYGKAYSHLDDVEKRMDSVADLAHANLWLRSQPSVDGDRIAVYGGSYGGFMVLSALVTYPELWAAGIDVVGISNFVTFLENTSDYRRSHRESEYGSLAQDREFLGRISPSNHVDKIVAPLMVVHGANDPRVPVTEAEQIVAALKERNVPVEFMVFDDEGHGIQKLKNKRLLYPAIVDFLRRVV